MCHNVAILTKNTLHKPMLCHKIDINIIKVHTNIPYNEVCLLMLGYIIHFVVETVFESKQYNLRSVRFTSHLVYYSTCNSILKC